MKINAIIITLMMSVANTAIASNSTTADGFKEALGRLGYSFSEHVDIEGEPHLVLTTNIVGVDEVAIFFDDCNYRGVCEDVTFYASFQESQISDGRLNGWNHIGAKNRSKAFRNNDGSVGLAYTVSYLNAQDSDGIAMITGLFMLESELFGFALKSN